MIQATVTQLMALFTMFNKDYKNTKWLMDHVDIEQPEGQDQEDRWILNYGEIKKRLEANKLKRDLAMVYIKGKFN